MESCFGFLLVLIATLAIIPIVQAQDQQGFISLDCGLPANEQSPYIENHTGLNFSSDATFIQSGKTGRIQANLVGRLLKPYTTLRYFPDGKRNCYNLTVEMERKYLIRASFIYGNYDGRDIKPVFDLYLGPNRWAKIDLETRVNGRREDIIHIPTSNSLQICLAKTGNTTPLISSLELRPMRNDVYNTTSGSLHRHNWYYFSKSGPQLRYSNDIYDRIWRSYFKMEWTQISTTLDVVNSNKFSPPKDVLKNAATPTNASAPLTFEWSSGHPDNQYYLYIHFAELQDLLANETREFNILLNGEHYYGPLTPKKLNLTTVFSRSPRTCVEGKCSIQLIRTNRSTLPPLLNAFEVYKVIQFPQSDTDESDGFINLDCGLPSNEQSPYIENNTGLNFSSDATFIQSGKTGRIQANLVGRLLKPYTTLRYFPDGIRNCYNLNVEMDRKYLIRASFTYGNYDGRDIKPVFDLYLGPNRWAKIDLETWVNGTREDIIHIPTSNSLQICLAKTGDTTPLISSLELRPMPNDVYITKSGSLNLYDWYYLSKSGSQLRYSSDIYDRVWRSYFKMEWTQISTTLDVVNSDKFAPPKDVLKNAVTPTNASAPLTFEWSSAIPDDQYYLYMHFAELQDLLANETREFNILLNGEHYYGPLTPKKLDLTTVFSLLPETCVGGKCSFQLIRTNRSTLPPLLNAFEVFKVIQFPQSETDESDVAAIKNIAATYRLSRINWQGDPCVPQHLRWDGLNCTNTDMFMPPRITTLNLSSSGLTGTIAAAIQYLTQLEKLDLSNNNLTGAVPEFLGDMKSLSVINLSGNNLNGSIPQALQREGLELVFEGNPSGKPRKKKLFVPIVASVASVAIFIAVLALSFVLWKKNSTTVEGRVAR